MSTPKKILIFEAYPFFSGAQKMSLTFCEVLKKNGYHLTLLLADDPDGILKQKFSAAVDEVILLKKFDAITQYGNADKWFKISVFFKSIFQGLLPFYIACFKVFFKGKFDCFYFCDPRGAVMMLPCIFFKAKKICYLQSKNKLNPLFSRLLFLTFFDTVICPSIDVLNSLPNSNKKKVLYYGIDFSLYNTVNTDVVKNEVNNIININDNSRKKMLFAGLIRPHKGVHHLIYAIKYLKDNIEERDMPLLFLLGSTKNEAERLFLDRLKAFAKENEIDKYIHWMGWKNNVLEWMAYSDYFVFCTIDKEKCEFEGFDEVIESSEGSPVVLIESSVCKLFALASEVTGVNETITDYHNGLKYDPNKPEALNYALMELLNKKPTYIDFPNQDRFSISRFETEVLNLVN